MNAETLVVVAALAGAAAGALLPRLIAPIPDREPATVGRVPGASDIVTDRRTPYQALAAAPHLSWYLAVATGVLWAVLVARLGDDAILAAVLLVVTLGVAMAYIDVREHRLPDWLTYPAFAGAALALAVAATITGDWSSYGRAWAGAIVLAGAFVVLALARPGELGFGDVKLVASLGLLLGWIGWGHVVLGAFLSFLLGGVLSIVLLSLRRAGRRTAIPFGPFLLAGTFIAIGWGDVLLDAYLG